MTDYRGYVIKPHAIRKREIEARKARAGDDWVDHAVDHPPEWYAERKKEAQQILKDIGFVPHI
jgi:hypothetical protein